MLLTLPDVHSRIRLRAVLPYVQRVRHTVDIGVGGGWVTSKIVRAKDLPAVTGIYDGPTPARYVPRVTWRKGSLPNLPIADGEADQVLLIDVLEHVDDDIAALREINRIMKPGGRLIVSVPNPMYPVYFTGDFANYIGHKRHYTREMILSVMDQAGFKIDWVEDHTFRIGGWLGRRWVNSLLKKKILPRLRFYVMGIVLNALSPLEVFQFGKPAGMIVVGVKV